MTPDLATLRDLQARVRQATGADREFDLVVLAALWPERYRSAIVNGGENDGHRYFQELKQNGSWYGVADVPVSSSIDAAVSLVERILPDAQWEVTRGCCAFISVGDHDIGDAWKAATPALALLSALLATLVAQASPVTEIVHISQEHELP